MAAAPNEFVAHCTELLSPLGAVRCLRMFGGHGLYVDEIFVAVVAFERLYLKVDAQTRPAFEATGSTPFVYDRQRQAVALGYFSAPEEAMESPPAMQPWARLALAAALRARAAKPRARAPVKKAAPRKGSAKSAPKKP
jgi:DNA transformation protein and related proteins